MQAKAQRGPLPDKQVDDLRLTERIYVPKRKMASHAHEPLAFSFVLKGSYTEKIGRRLTRTCQSSTLVFHPEDETHAVAFDNVLTRIFRVDVSHSWLERVRDCAISLNEPVAFQDVKISQIAERMYAEFQAFDQFSKFAIEGLMLELFAAVARGLVQREENKIPRWLERAREKLHDSFDEATSLQTIAESAGVHPVYLARQFRRFYHTSVGDYVRQLRIEKASRQLSNTNLTISEIALAAGFYDQSHFSNVFKKQTGFTPAEFRVNHRAG